MVGRWIWTLLQLVLHIVNFDIWQHFITLCRVRFSSRFWRSKSKPRSKRIRKSVIYVSFTFIWEAQLTLSWLKSSILSSFFLISRFSFYWMCLALVLRWIIVKSIQSSYLFQIFDSFSVIFCLERFKCLLFWRRWLLLLELDSLHFHDLGKLILILSFNRLFTNQRLIVTNLSRRRWAESLHIIELARYESFCFAKIWFQSKSFHWWQMPNLFVFIWVLRLFDNLPKFILIKLLGIRKHISFVFEIFIDVVHSAFSSFVHSLNCSFELFLCAWNSIYFIWYAEFGMENIVGLNSTI